MGISDQNDIHSGEDKPLSGRAVMVTRPLDQSSEITALLEKLGATVIHFPTIEVIEPASWDQVDRAIERLESYDLIVFTSANGPRFFFRRLLELRPNRPGPIDDLSVCAIGPATAKAVEANGARVDVIAKESKAEGALRTIIENAGGEQFIRGLRILIPRASLAREVLPAELAHLGAIVDDVEVYQSIKPAIDRQRIIELFHQRLIDAITFTSPSTISNLVSLIEPDNLREFFRGTLIACIGPVTSAAAIELGLENIVQPSVYNAQALVQTIVESLISSHRPSLI